MRDSVQQRLISTYREGAGAWCRSRQEQRCGYILETNASLSTKDHKHSQPRLHFLHILQSFVRFRQGSIVLEPYLESN